MRLTDYIIGKRVDLISPLPVDDVARRINAATPTISNPFRGGVGGWCRFGHLRLEWRVPIFHNGFTPVLSGRVSDDMGRTRIEGRFGMTRFLQAFYALWYAIVALLLLGLMGASVDDDPATWVDPIAFLVVPLFSLFPLGFHFIFNRGADRHLDRILDFLEREVQARPAP